MASEFEGMSFLTSGLQDFMDKEVHKPVENVCKNTALHIWQMINTENKGSGTYGSPVWTGAFIASHRIDVNTVDTSRVSRPKWRKNANKYTGQGLNIAKQELDYFRIGDVINISNTVQDSYSSEPFYAPLIEDYSLSKKTPQGVYKVAAMLAETSLQTNMTSYMNGVSR